MAAVLWLKRSGRGSGARPEQTRHDALGCDRMWPFLLRFDIEQASEAAASVSWALFAGSGAESGGSGGIPRSCAMR